MNTNISPSLRTPLAPTNRAPHFVLPRGGPGDSRRAPGFRRPGAAPLGCLAAVLLATTPRPASCAASAFPSDPGIGIEIPDGDLSGLARTITVSTSLGPVSDVNVRLHLAPGAEGAFVGDLYVALIHGERAAVLLNRPGREPGRSFGYSDARGLSILLDDQSALGDVHDYRAGLGRNPALPLPGVLTGAWQPDGRAVDPLVVSLSDPREASLSVFSGMPSEGDWNLFVADVSGGGITVLQDWSLEITAVPEPAIAGLAVAAALTGLAGQRALARTRHHVPVRPREEPAPTFLLAPDRIPLRPDGDGR